MLFDCMVQICSIRSLDFYSKIIQSEKRIYLTYIWVPNEFFRVFFSQILFEIFLFLLKLSYHMLCFHGFFSYACINFQFVNDIFSLFSIEYSWTICDFLEEKRAYCCCCCFYMIEMVLFERNLQNCAIFPSARKALSTTFSVVFFFLFLSTSLPFHVAYLKKIFACWNVLKRCRSLE